MVYLPHTTHNVYARYILQLTYIHGSHKVAVNRVRLLPSQLLWNFPDHLKSTAPQQRRKEIFGRQVTLKLKDNSATELKRIAEAEILPILRKQKGFRDETTLISPERSEAIANSFWDTKADAEAYDHTAYAEVLKTLSTVIDGTPTVKTFEFANSTFHQAAASKLM